MAKLELKLDHIPITDARPLGLVEMGSAMWQNSTPESDVDAWAIVIEPTERILRREGRYQDQSIFRSETEHNHPVDIHVHEVGRAVDLLLQGNINFVTGVMSPLVKYITPEFEALRRVTAQNPSKAIYGSVHGMAVQNFLRYMRIDRRRGREVMMEALRDNEVEPRRCAKMLSFIEFAIHYLDDGKLRFAKPCLYEWDAKGVDQAIRDLESAGETSALPAVPDPEPFRDLLFRLRVQELQNK